MQADTSVDLFVPEAFSRELSRMAAAAYQQMLAAARRALARDLPGKALLIATEFCELALLHPHHEARITYDECPELEGELLTCEVYAGEGGVRHIRVHAGDAIVLDVRLITVRSSIHEAQPPYATINGLDLTAGDVYAYLPGDWEQVIEARAAIAYAQQLLKRYNALQNHYLSHWGIPLGDIQPKALELSEEPAHVG
jgi:hypothetical protein